VESLQQSIYATRPPFVYGVLGDWGSGKTSILNLLYNLLDNDLRSGSRAFVPIRFDAWKYENEAHLIYPLLHAIKRDYQQRIQQPSQAFFEKFKTVALASALTLTDIGLKVATKTLSGEAISLDDIAGHLKTVKEHATGVEQVLSDWVDEVDRLETAFRSLLETYAEDLSHTEEHHPAKEDIRFVIMIDDLDRCLPDTVIAILESIKNYLSGEGCIFVLALNPKVVYQGIRAKYKNLEIDGREYLEKILNYSFYVPEPDAEVTAVFGSEALNKLVDEKDRITYSKYFDSFGRVIMDCHFTNPRKVRRILNHFLFFINLNKDHLESITIPTIIRLIVLAEYYPALFQLLIKDAKKTFDDLKTIGTPTFNVAAFEQQNGVTIAPIFPQLNRMVNLFNVPDTDPRLTSHVMAVYNIVRLPA
jgi:hypothetical protein